MQRHKHHEPSSKIIDKSESLEGAQQRSRQEWIEKARSLSQATWDCRVCSKTNSIHTISCCVCGRPRAAASATLKGDDSLSLDRNNKRKRLPANATQFLLFTDTRIKNICKAEELGNQERAAPLDSSPELNTRHISDRFSISSTSPRTLSLGLSLDTGPAPSSPSSPISFRNILTSSGGSYLKARAQLRDITENNGVRSDKLVENSQVNAERQLQQFHAQARGLTDGHPTEMSMIERIRIKSGSVSPQGASSPTPTFNRIGAPEIPNNKENSTEQQQVTSNPDLQTTLQTQDPPTHKVLRIELKKSFRTGVFHLIRMGLEVFPEQTLLNTFTLQTGLLQELKLSHNKLKTLPESFPAHLTSLTRLDLDHNRLNALPENMGHLSRLQILSVAHNQMSDLPQSFFLGLRSLKRLNLSHNAFQWLPLRFGSLGRAMEIQELSLQSNQLTYLPESFHELKSLEVLDLSYNHLEHLAIIPVVRTQLVKTVSSSSKFSTSLDEQDIKNIVDNDVNPQEGDNRGEMDGHDDILKNEGEEDTNEAGGGLISWDNSSSDAKNTKNHTSSLPNINLRLDLSSIGVRRSASKEELSLNSIKISTTSLSDTTVADKEIESCKSQLRQKTNFKWMYVRQNQHPVTTLQALGKESGNSTSVFERKHSLNHTHNSYFQHAVTGEQLEESRMPKEIDRFGDLNALRVLHLGNNRLKHLPPSLVYLSRLTLLEARNNELISLLVLPASLDRGDDDEEDTHEMQDSRQKAKQAEARRRNALLSTTYDALPPLLPKLEKIDVSCNYIQKLPVKRLSHLPRLKYLMLNNNYVESFQIKDSLNAQNGRNRRETPFSGFFPSLRSLQLANNRLKALPTQIGFLAALVDVNLFGNPFDEETSARLQQILSSSNPSALFRSSTAEEDNRAQRSHSNASSEVSSTTTNPIEAVKWYCREVYARETAAKRHQQILQQQQLQLQPNGNEVSFSQSSMPAIESIRSLAPPPVHPVRFGIQEELIKPDRVFEKDLLKTITQAECGKKALYYCLTCQRQENTQRLKTGGAKLSSSNSTTSALPGKEVKGAAERKKDEQESKSQSAEMTSASFYCSECFHQTHRLLPSSTHRGQLKMFHISSKRIPHNYKSLVSLSEPKGKHRREISKRAASIPSEYHLRSADEGEEDEETDSFILSELQKLQKDQGEESGTIACEYGTGKIQLHWISQRYFAELLLKEISKRAKLKILKFQGCAFSFPSLTSASTKNEDLQPINSEKTSLLDFSRLTRSLYEVFLSSCQLNSVSPSIFLLKRLVSLTLEHNNISLLQLPVTPASLQSSKPVYFHSLHSLETLNLSRNRLEMLPKELFIGLTRLRVLIISHNRIKCLPLSVDKLCALEKLDASCNALTTEYTTSDTLSLSQLRWEQLSNLRDLRLNDNKLSEIPLSMKDMQSLEILHLGTNQIREFPESLATSPCLRATLKSLWLVENRLPEIPVQFSCLQSLKDLKLGNNPGMISPPARYIDVVPPEVILQYCALRGRQVENLFEIFSEMEFEWDDTKLMPRAQRGERAIPKKKERKMLSNLGTKNRKAGKDDEAKNAKEKDEEDEEDSQEESEEEEEDEEEGEEEEEEEEEEQVETGLILGGTDCLLQRDIDDLVKVADDFVNGDFLALDYDADDVRYSLQELIYKREQECYRLIIDALSMILPVLEKHPDEWGAGVYVKDYVQIRLKEAPPPPTAEKQVAVEKKASIPNKEAAAMRRKSQALIVNRKKAIVPLARIQEDGEEEEAASIGEEASKEFGQGTNGEVAASSNKEGKQDEQPTKDTATVKVGQKEETIVEKNKTSANQKPDETKSKGLEQQRPATQDKQKEGGGTDEKEEHEPEEEEEQDQREKCHVIAVEAFLFDSEPTVFNPEFRKSVRTRLDELVVLEYLLEDHHIINAICLYDRGEGKRRQKELEEAKEEEEQKAALNAPSTSERQRREAKVEMQRALGMMKEDKEESEDKEADSDQGTSNKVLSALRRLWSSGNKKDNSNKELPVESPITDKSLEEPKADRESALKEEAVPTKPKKKKKKDRPLVVGDVREYTFAVCECVDPETGDELRHQPCIRQAVILPYPLLTLEEYERKREEDKAIAERATELSALVDQWIADKKKKGEGGEKALLEELAARNQAFGSSRIVKDMTVAKEMKDKVLEKLKLDAEALRMSALIPDSALSLEEINRKQKLEEESNLRKKIIKKQKPKTEKQIQEEAREKAEKEQAEKERQEELKKELDMLNEAIETEEKDAKILQAKLIYAEKFRKLRDSEKKVELIHELKTRLTDDSKRKIVTKNRRRARALGYRRLWDDEGFTTFCRREHERDIEWQAWKETARESGVLMSKDMDERPLSDCEDNTGKNSFQPYEGLGWPQDYFTLLLLFPDPAERAKEGDARRSEEDKKKRMKKDGRQTASTTFTGTTFTSSRGLSTANTTMTGTTSSSIPTTASSSTSMSSL